ncbi:MAG: bpX6 domain-containing protein [Burkholderiaceae bacterium]
MNPDIRPPDPGVGGPLRTPVLDGHRRVDALWFPAGWFDEARRRDELLGAWRRGCTAHRFEEGDLLRWPDGVPQDCGTLGGWPLQRVGTTLCSAAIAPSTAAEQAADVLLVVGARLRALRWSQGRPLDPSGWIAVDGFPLSDTFDFRLPPPARAVVAPAPRDLRAVLGNAIPDPDAKAQALLQALKQRAAASAPTAARGAAKVAGAGAQAPASRAGGGAWLPWATGVGLLGLLSQLLHAPQAPEPPQGDAPRLAVRDAAPAAPARPPRIDPGPRTVTPAAVPTVDASQDVAGSVLPASPWATSPPPAPRLDDVEAPPGAAAPRMAVPPRPSKPPVQARAPASEGAAAPTPAPAPPPRTPAAPAPGESDGSSSGPWNAIGAVLMLVVAGWIALILHAARRRLLSGAGGAKSGDGFAPIVMGRDGPTPAKAGPGAASSASGTPASDAGTKASGPAPATGAHARGRKLGAALRARAQRVLPQRWRAWLARLAMTSGVADLLGRQHAAYMRRMLALFEEGDLDAALRHALPLGSGHNSLGQALGRLAPRRELALGQQRGAGTSVGIGDDLERHLRALYRRTFEHLDRAGRIDEATYVLAELLAQRGEALDYLEKHARLAQAAELALAWDMPAARIVRLLAQAGDWRRAVLVAQRDDAFAAAIAQLESRWRDAAVRLRREWAHRLAARGRSLEAVHAIWPVEAERASALEWLQQIEAAGGPAAARALVLRAQCLPDTLRAREPALRALRDDPARAADRVAMARELLAAQTQLTPAVRQLAATIAGALVADHADPDAPLDAAALRGVIERAGDPLLSADQPAGGLPERPRAWLDARSDVLVVPAPDPGLHAIADAVPVADDGFLVALGEAGAMHVDARGCLIARFEVPAHRLVVAHDGGVALALGRRDRSWRVNRLDLARGRAFDLGLGVFGAFADTFDGAHWTVADGRRVQVLDVTRDDLREATWQVADLPGPVHAIDASRTNESWILGDGPERLEAWHYVLPQRRLAARETLRDHAGRARVFTAPGRGAVALSADLQNPATSGLINLPPRTGVPVTCPTPAPDHPARASVGWIAMRKLRAAGPGRVLVADAAIDLVSLVNGRAKLRVQWPAEVHVGMRPVGTTWTLFDAEGRLFAVDATGSRVRTISLR